MEPDKGDLSLSEIPILPKIRACKPLDRISFSVYAGMKSCLLKGLPYRCITFSPKLPLFPKSKAQLVGIFFHTMLERVSELRKYDRSDRPSRLKSEFHEQLRKFSETFSEYSWLLATDSISSLPEMGVIYDQISRIVFSKDALGQKENSGMTVFSEKDLTSKDKLLYGIVDVLIENSEGKVIVEYKTNEIFDGKFLKNQHYLQVHFYAELVHEKFGAYPKCLVVQGPKGRSWKMSPDVEVARKLGQDARTLLGHYNSRVNNDNPLTNIAQVSSEACSGCQYQAFCPEYWSNCDKIDMSEKVQSLKIKELSILKGKSTHKSALKVHILNGKMKGKDLLIDGFYPNRFSNYLHQPGRELVITNLIVDYYKISGRFTETSQIYNILADK